MKTTPAGADASASAEAQPPAGVDGCPTGGPGACADGREGAGAPGLGEAVRVLFELKLDEMSKTGRQAEMTRRLETVLRDSRAARAAEDAYDCNR